MVRALCGARLDELETQVTLLTAENKKLRAQLRHETNHGSFRVTLGGDTAGSGDSGYVPLALVR